MLETWTFVLTLILLPQFPESRTVINVGGFPTKQECEAIRGQVVVSGRVGHTSQICQPTQLEAPPAAPKQ